MMSGYQQIAPLENPRGIRFGFLFPYWDSRPSRRA